MKERFSAGGQDSPSSFTVSDIASRSSFSTSRWTASLEPLIAMLANLGESSKLFAEPHSMKTGLLLELI